jgi:tetratricopeptide (TPR) repeat protein
VIDPELAQRHFRRGNTYNNLERYDDAIEEYQLSITADPNFAESVRNLANIFYFQERYEETIPLLQRFIALQTEPTAPLIASYNTLGQLLRDAKRFEESIDVDILAIQHDPDNTSQVFIMANTYFNANLTDDAIKVYETALTVNPNDAFIHRSLGRMYEEMGRLEDALAQYQAASELDVGSQFYRDLVNNLQNRLAQ